jgi:hypothetical protein
VCVDMCEEKKNIQEDTKKNIPKWTVVRMGTKESKYISMSVVNMGNMGRWK